MNDYLNFFSTKTRRVRLLAKKYLPMIIFIFSVGLNYLPDIAPYYSALISQKQLYVLGDLNSYVEKCDEYKSNEQICKSQYRIPYSLHVNHEAIGLGVILFSINASCSNRPDKKVDLVDNVFYNKVAVSLKTYRVLPLRMLNCTDDIIIRNYAPETNIRHGVAQSILLAGNERAVWQAKQLVELSISGSLALISFLFLAVNLVLVSLQNVTDIKISFSVFEKYKFILLIQVLLMSGIISAFYPYNNYSFDFITHLTQFFGLLVLLGPVVDFLLQKSRFNGFCKNQPRKVVSAIVLLVAVTQLTVLANFYAYFIVTIGILALFISINFRDRILFFFALSIVSDGCKILMIPGLPASRCSIFYLLLLLVYQTRNQIKHLQENARIEAGANISLKLAHDIRSPLAVITNLTPKLSGNTELKNLISAAIIRIREITTSLLEDAKSDSKNLIAEVCDLKKICEEVSDLKRYEYLDHKNITLTVDILGEPPSLVLISQSELRRILSNILNNAFESFTDSSGEIVMRTYFEREFAVVEIVDNGRGISEDQLRSIGIKGISLKDSGNGLGLYFAKKLLSKWNGRLEIFSEPNTGTTIKISIPKYIGK